jgi:hypothetical protein
LLDKVEDATLTNGEGSALEVWMFGVCTSELSSIEFTKPLTGDNKNNENMKQKANIPAKPFFMPFIFK